MYRKNETSIFLLKIRCARSRPGEDVINEGGVQNPVFYRLKLALACGRIFGEAQLEPCRKCTRASMFKNMRGV